MKFLTPILYDPQLALTDEEQKRIGTSVFRAFTSKGLGRFIFMLSFMTWGIITITLFMYLGKNGTALRFLLFYMLLVFPIGTSTIGYLLIRFGLNPLINQELHDRGYDLCIKCSYILIDLPNQTNCPECGSPRTPLPQNPKTDKPYY